MKQEYDIWDEPLKMFGILLAIEIIIAIIVGI